MPRLANILLLLSIYLILADASLQECEESLSLWLQEALTPNSTSDYRKMFLYSGKGVNDLGLYHQCNDLSGSKYVVFEINEAPAIVLALCLPDQCSISNYWTLLGYPPSDSSSSSLSSYINSLTSAFTLENPSILPAHKSRMLASSSSPFERIVFPKDHVKRFSDMTASAAGMLVFCIIIMLLAVIGTAVEISSMSFKTESIIGNEGSKDTSINSDKVSLGSLVQPEKERNASKILKILMCFSLYGNTVRLFATKDEKRKDPLDCLNAVRVFSIAWVCYGHTNLFRIDNSVVINVDAVQPYFSHLAFMIPISATYAVDSFFWLSGFLQGYLMTLQLSSKKKVNWPMIVIHRFIRILPIYMFIVLLSWTMGKYAGDGPKWYNADKIMHKDCYDYFWTYAFFLNNIVLPKGSNNCVVGLWYLPNDMQFFLVSLPIMYLYTKHSRVFGWGLLLTCITFSIIANGTISYNEHFHARLDHSENNKYYMDDLYYKPWCRIAPYCIGLLGGFVYHAFKKSKSGESFDPLAASIAQSLNENKYVRYVWYITGLFLLNFFIFIQYSAYDSYNNWSRSQNSAFFAFQRFCWGMGMNLFFLPMLMGHLSFFRPFLQSNWWMPTAKLVFGVYLLHMVVGQIYFFSQPVSYFWSEMNLFVDALFVLVTTFLLVIPITLFIESPAANLEKLLLRS